MTFSIPTIGKSNYEGTLNPSWDELKYMKKSLDIPENLVFESLSNNVFKINNVVIKILNYQDDSQTTCELTKRAHEEGVGVQYFNHVSVTHNNGPSKRVYLFTEYLPIISHDFNKTLIEDFATKIRDTTLLFHPDFWYKNICITASGELKAINWDGMMYNMKSGQITKDNSVIKMMERYNYKLSQMGGGIRIKKYKKNSNNMDFKHKYFKYKKKYIELKKKGII